MRVKTERKEEKTRESLANNSSRRRSTIENGGGILRYLSQGSKLRKGENQPGTRTESMDGGVPREQQDKGHRTQ